MTSLSLLVDSWALQHSGRLTKEIRRHPLLELSSSIPSSTTTKSSNHQSGVTSFWGAQRFLDSYGQFKKARPRYPAYTEHAHKGHGWPLMWVVTSTKPSWQPHLEEEYEVVARDEYGVPMQIPPEISTEIKHVYYVPPQYFPFLKKLGDDTPALMPFMEKLINGQFTRIDYEEMFYRFAKPLKIYRRQMIMPYRTVEEMTKSAEIDWEGAWLSYRQRVWGEFSSYHVARDWILVMIMAGYGSYMWVETQRAHRVSMKLFYLEAPEHKINWVRPRGDRA